MAPLHSVELDGRGGRGVQGIYPPDPFWAEAELG